MADDDRKDRFTWTDKDVEWEFIPDPDAKPLLTPEQAKEALKRLDELGQDDDDV